MGKAALPLLLAPLPLLLFPSSSSSSSVDYCYTINPRAGAGRPY